MWEYALYGSMAVELNGVLFEYHPEWKPLYKFNYEKIARKIEAEKDEEIRRGIWRAVLREDLWAIVAFIMKVPGVNHPYVLQACMDVGDGPRSDTLDLWFRGGFKSTIITVAETIQDLIKDPEERICFLSYVRPAAQSYLRQIKQTLESSDLLRWAYPDIFYGKPEAEAFRWSEDVGLYVKRKSMAKECSLEAWGLIDGMPTRMHYTKIIYDDVVTPDYVGNPEIMKKVIERYEMSLNLLSKDGRKRVVGTTYHYEDLLSYLREKKDSEGDNVYKVRVKPATDNGQMNGRPVWHSEAFNNELKTDPATYQSQQLLDPSPEGVAKLAWQMVDEVGKLPTSLYKFLLVDGAGDKPGDDSWSIMLLGVDPFRDDLGASDLYVLDAVISPFDIVEAMDTIVAMYIRAGKVLKVGVEKVA
jgi:hypothetical protein